MESMIRTTTTLETPVVEAVWSEIPFRVKIKGLSASLRYALLFVLKTKNPKKFADLKKEFKEKEGMAAIIEEVEHELR